MSKDIRWQQRFDNQELPLPYHFDVVDYATIERPEFRQHIDAVGQCVYRRQSAE